MKDKLIKLGLTDELAQKVVDNLGTVLDGEYVTKTRFNEVNGELKTANDTIKERDGQIDKLSKSTGDVDSMKKEIEDLKTANKESAKKAAEDLAAERKSNAIKLELTGKVHNTDLTMNLLKLDEIIMDDSGKVKSGLKEQLDGLKKSDNYLFIPENKGDSKNPNLVIKGATPKEGDPVPPSNLTKGEIFAKGLAAKTNESVKNSADSIYFGETK